MLARAAQRAGVKRFIFLSSISTQSGPHADQDLTRQPRERAGRDEKMLAAEPKDGFKKEDSMPST